MRHPRSSSLHVMIALGSFALVTSNSTAQQSSGAVRAVPATPAQSSTLRPAAVAPAAAPVVAPPAAVAGATPPVVAPTGPAMLSPAEILDLKREYDAASDADRTALRAMYRDMGIDIDKVFAGMPDASIGGAAPTATNLVQAVKTLEFGRTPQAVLAARSSLGFGTAPKPDATNFDATAKWLQLQVMAGEWDSFTTFLASIPASDASAIFSHILQSISKPGRGDPQQQQQQQQQQQGGRQPDPALLPEEVLAIADAAPTELSDWQVDVLAQLLKSAATKYSTGPMLESLDKGARWLGKRDDAARARTVRFLVGAGLIIDAYAYFPSLDEVRQKGDAKALLNHGRYHQDLANSSKGGSDADDRLRTAWEIFCEVTLMANAEAALRQDAMRRAIDLLPMMPPAQASTWLKKVFASESLAPAALEIIALKAVSLRNMQLDLPQRAQTILTMKESVDTLLAQTGMDVQQLKVPLRMLTTALVGEAEAALEQQRQQQQQQRYNNYYMVAVPQEMEFLLRAMPDERWMGVLEPSLASRAYRAAIATATAADEIDVALDYLDHALQRFPTQGVDLADQFLQRWEKRMSAAPMMDPNQYFFMGYVRDNLAAAPLTRGRQRRNLERLTRLMNVLDGIGVESRRLPSVASVFKACHGNTEIFTRDGIESVFGSVDRLTPETAASLAEQMRVGLSGDWRDRQAQQAAGMKRTPAEITAMVEKGYALAIELVERSIAANPKSWRNAVTKAGLTYDRVQFKQAQEKSDFATYNQYRKEAFAAFAQTADRYAEMVRSGDQRDDPSVYVAWFNAAMGATELNYLTRDDLLVEGSPQDDQIDLIRKSLNSLPPDAAQRHIGAFARVVTDGLARANPDVKPRVVRHTMRIVGDHPAGAALRRLSDLYQDLVKDEIKLRLAIDGDDRVGGNREFGATLTLRFTAEVDRETGGFSRYLQNDVWARVGNAYKPMNYRDQLKKSLESALGDHFEVSSIGFFEALAPPKPVHEAGEDGWMEKPLAYLVLKAKDPSIDRVPQMSMDMHFNDTAGPVVLPVVSNAPPIDAATDSGLRPLKKLEVMQTLDLRDLDNGDKDRAVTLEVHAKAEGVVPELDQLLPNFRTALPGYEVAAKGVEARPMNLIQADSDAMPRYFYSPQAQETKGYIEPDETGAYRLPTERSWLITYTPTGGQVGGAFVLPALAAGLNGALVSRQFADMDIVNVTAATVAVQPSLLHSRNFWAIAIAAVVVITGAVVFALRRRTTPTRDDGFALPVRVSPLSVITTLRRIREERGAALQPAQNAELGAAITELERRYFGPDDESSGNGELKRVLERWAEVARG